MDKSVKVGVSACLLGQKVRYDGGHKLDRYLRDVLGKYVHLIAVCPETESGMSVPREAMHLVGDAENPRLMTVATGRDFTEIMREWAGRKTKALEEEKLSGFIFKSKSPSSGMERIKLYNDKGRAVNNKGRGIFAAMFMQRFPLIPVEDEGRLNDPMLRENFITRIFVFGRWLELMDQGLSAGRLVDFHTRHKLLVMSHNVEAYRELGRMVASPKDFNSYDLAREYITRLMGALKLYSTVKKNVNVLQHVAGYFKKNLSKDEKEELQEILNRYASSLVPLIVPVTLLNHYVRKYDQDYLKKQIYLNPHPAELKLRNQV